MFPKTEYIPKSSYMFPSKYSIASQYSFKSHYSFKSQYSFPKLEYILNVCICFQDHKMSQNQNIFTRQYISQFRQCSKTQKMFLKAEDVPKVRRCSQSQYMFLKSV